MRPSRHIAISLAAGGAVWGATGEPLALPAAVAAGVLVDVDHAPDLWWSLALRRTPVATLALHAWEWVTALTVVGIWTRFPWWLVAVLVGYSLHVITDHIANKGERWTYSILYRARHRFQIAKLAPRWRFEHTQRVLQQELPPLDRLVERWQQKKLARSRDDLTSVRK